MSYDPPIDLHRYRAAVALKGTTQWRIAATLEICPSTFSAMLRGRTPAPEGFVKRVETALGVKAGSLRAKKGGGGNHST